MYVMCIYLIIYYNMYYYAFTYTLVQELTSIDPVGQHVTLKMLKCSVIVLNALHARY